jgi:HSP20 family protein
MQPSATADMIETDNDFYCTFDVPGVENIEVSTDGNILEISGERKKCEKHDDANALVHRRERTFGKVSRRLTLPNSADLDKAKAKYKDGVMCVCIPKKEGEKKRRILPISSA